ncbi:hypothetical protein IPA_04025 [Ignicoccus pacificus DSM 13166]|uniref:Uncharacterized protein n=1 Tax=Ignicoccus pacificus DSM 13166 TaxID=940294 RepID=A0A977KB39_9CREN|nr:hypothetical protein IPA_04025 [Ignicoccus pacificus DSM 13166]
MMRKKLLKFGGIGADLVTVAAALILAVGVIGFIVKVLSALGVNVPVSGLPVATATVSASPFGSVSGISITA